jgi:hypothetical protein
MRNHNLGFGLIFSRMTPTSEPSLPASFATSDKKIPIPKKHLLAQRLSEIQSGYFIYLLDIYGISL